MINIQIKYIAIQGILIIFRRLGYECSKLLHNG